MTQLCETFAVSRSGYYAWCQRQPSVRQQTNARLLKEIQALRQGQEACYGSPRMTEELKGRGYQCSEKRIARLMHQHGLRAQARPRFVPCTTDSNHDLPVAPNRLAQTPAPDGPTRSGCKTSPTCRPRKAGCIWRWCWTCGVARSSAGRWPIISAANLVVSALQMACTQRRPAKGLLVHSDRGVQYASQETRALLARHGWVASMSRQGNPYDNAWMESAIGKIKNEVLGRTLPADHAAARQQLFVGIEGWYNQRRPHSALGYQSPVAFETQFMKN